MNMPLVSILLPSYNHDKYIEEAILSAINQTYKNIELIVIDDGSTDKSDEIIRSLQSKYSFKYIHRKNKGLIKTFEELFSYAHGDYISLFSSDDLYKNNKIEVLVEYLENNKEYDIAYSKISIIDEHSNIIKHIDENYYSGYIFDNLLKGDFFINGLGVLIKTNIYKKYQRTDSYIDDLQLWLKMSKNHRFGFIDEYLSYYRIHNNHLSSNLFKMQKAEYEIISKYSNEPIFDEALRKWNIRWLGSFGKCNKIYTIKHFLFKNIKFKNFFDLNFYKSLLKLLIPCFIFKRIK
ncbi:glycosyltransferase family 2 protein [Aliarcobacter butzleri]|uniref:glycosyltransferase family 2 protein n=1 Tax=Aliarcobacter butzleri TaxID=28197 RepID=UPI0021B20059|nr:glycosyltransferase [Aliarcobacter butzleri]MCT7568958.1 glycosyltransferase [Aliarcobacter butzleri]